MSDLERGIGLLYFANGAESSPLLWMLHPANQARSVDHWRRRPRRPLYANRGGRQRQLLGQSRNKRLTLPIYICQVLSTVRGKPYENFVQWMWPWHLSVGVHGWHSLWWDAVRHQWRLPCYHHCQSSSQLLRRFNGNAGKQLLSVNCWQTVELHCSNI